MRALGIWIPVTERLPNPTTCCWVWYKEDDKEGFCERMIYSDTEGWKKNELSAIKPEYQGCIVAWQPYYEPLHYVYISQERKKTITK